MTFIDVVAFVVLAFAPALAFAAGVLVTYALVVIYRAGQAVFRRGHDE